MHAYFVLHKIIRQNNGIIRNICELSRNLKENKEKMRFYHYFKKY
jgi:hypothetical protein